MPEIESLQGLPNPNPLQVMLKLSADAEKVELRVYSKAMVCVAEVEGGAARRGWVKLPWPKFSGSNGLYYVVARAGKGGAWSQRKDMKALLLR